jgi:hypothetical protein
MARAKGKSGHLDLALRWTEHADINDVMLATSLAPVAFLGLGDRPP